MTTPVPAPTPTPSLVSRLVSLAGILRPKAVAEIHQAEAVLETAEAAEAEADTLLHKLDAALEPPAPPAAP